MLGIRQFRLDSHRRTVLDANGECRIMGLRLRNACGKSAKQTL